MVWILATILTTTFFSCEKDDDPFKECRKNPDCEYFTCKVNGKRWEPRCDGGPLFGCTPWDVQYYRNLEWFIMNVRNDETNQTFLIYIEGNLQNNTIHEIFTNENSPSFLREGILQDSCTNFKIINDENSYFEIINIDFNQRKIKGKFSFIGKNDCGDEAIITDGEFNLLYRF